MGHRCPKRQRADTHQRPPSGRASQMGARPSCPRSHRRRDRFNREVRGFLRGTTRDHRRKPLSSPSRGAESARVESGDAEAAARRDDAFTLGRVPLHATGCAALPASAQLAPPQALRGAAGGAGGRSWATSGRLPAGNPALCGNCIRSLQKIGIMGAEIPVSLLFADIRGSTTIAERMAPPSSGPSSPTSTGPPRRLSSGTTASWTSSWATRSSVSTSAG